MTGGDSKSFVTPGQYLEIERAAAHRSEYFQGEMLAMAGARDTLLNPTFIAEVLSPSTEAYDRGRKFEYYRILDSLVSTSLSRRIACLPTYIRGTTVGIGACGESAGWKKQWTRKASVAESQCPICTKT